MELSLAYESEFISFIVKALNLTYVENFISFNSNAWCYHNAPTKSTLMPYRGGGFQRLTSRRKGKLFTVRNVLLLVLNQ